MPGRKMYSDAQKAAYYKRRAGSKSSRVPRIIGRGSYKVSRARGYQNSIQGRGGYYDSSFVKTMQKYIPKGTFGTVGNAIGNAFKPGVGGKLGQVAGDLFSKLAGFGRYEVKNNSLMMGEGQSPPQMHSSGSSLIITHREYICDIVSSGSASTFSIQAFPINPGLVQSYPWLSAIGQQFEEYQLLGMIYEYKTLSATAVASSTNTTMGGIIMGTDYNSINANFVNKQQMDNTEYTTSAPVYDSFYHPIECDPKQSAVSAQYIRSGAVPSSSDQRLYDLGIFQIASFGVQGTSVVLGELWCSYQFKLMKPISTTALGQDVLTDHFRLTGIANTTPLGTTSTIQANSSIGGTISTAGLAYVFPPTYQEGTYMFYYNVIGTTQVTVAPIITLTNCAYDPVLVNGGQGSLSSPNSVGTTTTFFYIGIVNLTGANAKIAFGASGTLPSTPSSGDWIVTQFDSSIVV